MSLPVNGSSWIENEPAEAVPAASARSSPRTEIATVQPLGAVETIVAEIGEVIQQHLVSIGMMEGQLNSPELEMKKQKIKEKMGADAISNANQCPKCAAMALVRMDNCDTCLECGHSKCG